MKNRLLSLFFLLSIPTFAQTYSADQYLKEGMELHGKSQYNDAINSYKKVHASDPLYHTAQYEIINSLLADGKKESALQLSTELYEKNLQKQFPTFLAIYGTVLSENEQYEKAHKIYNEGLDINPRSTHLLFNKAIVYIKQDKKQEAIDLFKKVNDIDPTHTSALYNLGIIALEDGKIVEGSLALMTYLLFEPYSYNSKNALIALNKKYHQNYSNKSILKYSETGDDFKELEQMLQAQVQYNKNYKLKINIDDIAIRNMQIIIDYFENHTFKDGYFENKFGKNFQKIAQSQNTNHYLMTSLLTISDNFEKEFSKNEKDIKNYIETYLKKEIYENHTIGSFEGKKYKVIRDNGEKVFIPINEKNEYEGIGYVENTLGALRATLTYKNNNLEGKKTYYFDNGLTSFTEHFKKGEIEGLSERYARNGKKLMEYYAVKDIANGAYKRFYPTGGLECEGNFVDDNYNGETKCYFPDGTIQTIVNYKNGTLHGPFKKYNESGKIIIEAQYKDDQIDGFYKEYYHDGVLKQEAIYQNGKPVSNTNYYPNKNIKSSYTYQNGKLNTIEYFTYDGQIYKRETYDGKEEYSLVESFGKNKEKYQTHHFKNGNYSHSEYNLSNINSSKSKSKNSYINYNSLGIIVTEGNFSKTKPVGTWNYYDQLGLLISKNTFDSDGNYLKTEGFLNNGDKDFTVQYKDGQYYGLYEDFWNNKTKFTQYYDENGLNGPEVSYYDNGITKAEGFYVNNNLSYDLKYYTLDGVLFNKNYYINDKIVESTFYLTDKENSFDFYGKTGTFKLNISPLVSKEFSLKNGVYDGKVIEKANQIILSETNYKNGALNGVQKFYGIHSKLDYELQYINGSKHGELRNYDENGSLKTVSNYEWDKEQGLRTSFLVNGKKYTEYTNIENEKHGVQYFYGGTDEPIASVEYHYGTPISYQVLDVNGILSQKKDITEQPIKIESFYANGKKALEIHFKNRMYDSNYTIYYTNGNKALDVNYINGRLEGKETMYYENGSVYSEKNFKNHKLDGIVTFYDKNNSKIIESNYKEDYLHGEYKIYENNKIKHKYVYNTDILVSN